jgi:hypothetical protein
MKILTQLDAGPKQTFQVVWEMKHEDGFSLCVLFYVLSERKALRVKK